MIFFDPAEQKPKAGYLLSLCAGLVGFTFDAIALGAIDLAHNGRDATEALSGVGTFAFGYIILLCFAMRLIFWPRSSERVRVCVRAVLTGTLVISLLCAVIGVVLLACGFSPGRSGLAIYFAVPAALCQVGSVVWLLRYRRV